MVGYTELLTPRTSSITHDAAFWRRALGFMIDIVILDMIVTLPFTPMFASLVARAEQTGFFSVTYTQKELGAIIMLFLIVYAYFVIFEYVIGQTIGMMIMKTSVKRGSLWQHLVRKCFLIPVFPFMLFWFTEPIAILLNRRGLLERLSRTRTVYHRKIVI